MMHGKIPVNVVTKFCLSNPDVIAVLNSEPRGSRPVCISDSNMVNFVHLAPEIARSFIKCVIKTRLSDIQKIPELPEYARPDRLFVSDERLLDAVLKLPKSMRPQIVIIAETGDMKDGVVLSRIVPLVQKWKELSIIGISVNFACLSGILPDESCIRKLAAVAEEVCRVRKLESPFLSIGGTVSCELAASGVIDGLIQEIRMGEGIFFGYDSSGGKPIPDMHHDVIELAGEILEVSEKDFSIQKGHQAGFTAIGEHGGAGSSAPCTGVRKRAVLDFGVLAANANDLVPFDTSLLFAGQTFDFTVTDITDSSVPYVAGDFIRFNTNYSSASFSMMNRYIQCTVSEEE